MTSMQVSHNAPSGSNNTFVTVNNNAEGCAPLSVAELARAVCEVEARNARAGGAPAGEGPSGNE